MGKLIDSLIASGEMGLYVDLRTGSYRDQTGTCTATLTGTPAWRMTRAGRGLFYGINTPAPSYISYGNPAALKLQALTIFGAMVPMNYHIYNYMVGRGHSYDREMIYLWSDGTVRAYSNGGWVYNSGLTVPLDSPFFASWRIQFPGNNRFCVNGAFSAEAVTLNALDVLRDWGMAGRKNTASSAVSENTEGTVLLGGVVKRCLTDAEMDQLYREWRAEGWPGRLPRRNFSFPYPQKTPAEYTAQAIALDSPMTRRGNVVPDLSPSGYNGTSVGPGDQTREAIFEEGRRDDGASYVNFGDVTQLNLATRFTFSCWVKFADVTTGQFLISKDLDAGPNIWGVYTNAGEIVWYIVVGGVGAFGYLASGTVRAGEWYHMVWVFDGAGVANADRLKCYLNGAAQTLYWFATIPAALPNLAGAPLIQNARQLGVGGAFTQYCKATVEGTRIWSDALTQAEVTAEYLEGAKLPVILDRGEDVPVTISGLASGPIPGSGFEIVSGTWNVTEDPLLLDRRLSISVQGPYQVLATRSLQNTGTWYWRAQVKAGASRVVFAPISLGRGDFTAINGYAVQTYSGSGWALQRWTGGASTNLIAYTGTCTDGITYEHVLTRTLAGVFKLYVRGGVYSSWTLLGTATDTTYWTGSYAQFVTDYTLCYPVLSQPGNKQAGFVVYRGVLDPTLGQLPIP